MITIFIDTIYQNSTKLLKLFNGLCNKFMSTLFLNYLLKALITNSFLLYIFTESNLQTILNSIEFRQVLIFEKIQSLPQIQDVLHFEGFYYWFWTNYTFSKLWVTLWFFSYVPYSIFSTSNTWTVLPNLMMYIIIINKLCAANLMNSLIINSEIL